MVYLDNASTSYPKPSSVIEEINRYLSDFGVSPGRGAYDLADQAELLVDQTRQKLARVIGASRSSHVVFTNNATHSLNIAIKGVLNEGDHALICSYSHNSVIRPMDKLKRHCIIDYDVFEIDNDGVINFETFVNKVNDKTRLVVINHASNVIGVIASILEVSEYCQEKGIKVLLDCTQSLGYFPFKVDDLPVDILAGTGHKTLLGPSGVGFLYVKNPRHIQSLMEGGSGGSHSSSTYHPFQMPHKLEAGTLNTTAISGLNGSLKYIEDVTFKSMSKTSMDLTKYAWDYLSSSSDIVLYGTDDMEKKFL